MVEFTITSGKRKGEKVGSGSRDKEKSDRAKKKRQREEGIKPLDKKPTVLAPEGTVRDAPRLPSGGRVVPEPTRPNQENPPIILGRNPEDDNTIFLGGEKTVDTSISGQIQRLRAGESGGVLDNPIARVLGDPRTTGVLAGTLGLLTVGKGLAARGAAGTAGNTTKVAGKYVSNPKTAAMTNGLFSSLGMSVAAAGGLLTIIGTYPFAGFLKEEALQDASQGFKFAFDAGDFEGAQEAVNLRAEILNPSIWRELINLIPFANVQASLRDYWKADTQALANQQEALNRAVGGEPNLFEIQNTQRKARENNGGSFSFSPPNVSTETGTPEQTEELRKEVIRRFSTEKSSLNFGLLQTILTLLRVEGGTN